MRPCCIKLLLNEKKKWIKKPTINRAFFFFGHTIQCVATDISIYNYTNKWPVLFNFFLYRKPTQWKSISTFIFTIFSTNIRKQKIFWGQKAVNATTIDFFFLRNSYSNKRIVHPMPSVYWNTHLRAAGVACINALSLIKHFVHCLIGCGEEAEQSGQGLFCSNWRVTMTVKACHYKQNSVFLKNLCSVKLGVKIGLK